MHYFFEDLTGVAAASLLALPLLVMPGFGLAALLARAGVMPASPGSRTCWGLVLGASLLPAVDALLLRWLGMPAVLALHLALAAAGIGPAVESARRVPLRWWAAVAACFAAAAWTNVDFDWNGRLYQSVIVIDGVKHAAVVGALATSGVPLHDPFFARPGISGYYYYFYIGPALLHWLGAPLVDSRAGFAAGTLATLLAFPAMLMLVAEASALVPHDRPRRFFALVALLCCVSGLDLIPGLWLWAIGGHPYAQLDWWSEEVRWALTSVLWVPHHLTAVIAVFVACLLLLAPGNAAARTAAAGLAFATAFGCSVWIAVAAVPILLLWWLYERLKTGTAGIWPLPLSGLVALAVSLPQIADIQSGRAPSGPPLAFYMRPLGPVRVLPHSLGEWIVHLAVTPGGYLVEFGIFALGAIVFLTRGAAGQSRATPMGRLLLVSAPVALVLVTFLRSAILYNDFGWRSIWFAQVPALLWTAAVLSTGAAEIRRSPLWAATLALGLAATLWDMAGMRFIRPAPFLTFINEHPDVDYDARGAYAWIGRNVPADVVVQHYPGYNRGLDFGLYSDRPVAVADGEARLFGAPERQVEARMALLNPIFERPMAPSELEERAARAGAGGLLLTSADPLWRAAAGPPSSWMCRYRTRHVCVMLLERSR
ncbi:MAG: hypothetical protein ACM3ZV_06120 [Bacillota bacterium]